jgi:hypothetical protein
MMAWLPLLFKFNVDERFVMHRYKSTRAGLIAGLLVMFAWLNYDMWVNDVVRWDYLAILGAMAAVKVASMIYLQRTD